MTRYEYLLNVGANIEGLIGPDEEVDDEFIECVLTLENAIDNFTKKYVENNTDYIS